VAAAHTQMVGGIEGVARAKGELVEALPADGVAVLNADQPLVAAMRSRTSARVLTFGAAGSADVCVRDLELDHAARPRFRVDTPWGTASVALAVPGAHMAVNAVAAVAVAAVCGVPLADAAGALSDARLSPWRMELCRTASGAMVLNDAYNANPASMRAALETLAALPGDRRVAVLGIMAELDAPEREHADVSARARALGIEVVAVGTDLYGPDPVDDVTAALGPLGAGDVVLVKGSRVAGLERVAAQLSR